eukprot:scaffold6461_cov145-Skeletonema_menzelii.AAC.1
MKERRKIEKIAIPPSYCLERMNKVPRRGRAGSWQCRMLVSERMLVSKLFRVFLALVAGSK